MTTLEPLLEKFFDARLEDRRDSGLKFPHLVGVFVHADDVIAQLGKNNSRWQAHISRTDYRNFHSLKGTSEPDYRLVRVSELGPVTNLPSAYLLDIEGTTTPIDFVTRTLFPYARKHLAQYLEDGVEEADLLNLSEERDLDGEYSGPQADLAYLEFLMDNDRKSTALKSIQGKIWASGYQNGDLRGEVYPDVIPAILRWRSRGAGVFIYSSGSVLAQKLIFGHLPEGSILDLIDGHFDTHIGGKKVSGSYVTIARELNLEPAQIRFLTDIAEEAEAASHAGMSARIIRREANETFDDEP